MYINNRVIFYLKGDESVLLEAIFGSEGETVRVSYQQYGVPHYRGYLYPTAKRHLDKGEWVILSQESLVA